MSNNTNKTLYDYLTTESKGRSILDDFMYTSDGWNKSFRSRVPTRRPLSVQKETNQSVLPPPRKIPDSKPKIEKEDKIEVAQKKEDLSQNGRFEFPEFTLVNERQFSTFHTPSHQLQKFHQQHIRKRKEHLDYLIKSALESQRNAHQNPAYRMGAPVAQQQFRTNPIPRANSCNFGPTALQQNQLANAQRRPNIVQQPTPQQQVPQPPDERDFTLKAEYFDFQRRCMRDFEQKQEAIEEAKKLGMKPVAVQQAPPQPHFDQYKRMQEFSQQEREKRERQEKQRMLCSLSIQKATSQESKINNLINVLTATPAAPPRPPSVQQNYGGHFSIPTSHSVSSSLYAEAKLVQQGINARAAVRPNPFYGMPNRPFSQSFYVGAAQARALSQMQQQRIASSPANDIPPAPYINQYLLKKDYGLISSSTTNIPVQVDKSDKSIKFTDQSYGDSPYGVQATKNQARLEWNKMSFQDDKYYTSLKVSRENRMHQNIQHSDPALNLTLVEPNLKDFENFHHPFLNTKEMIGKLFVVRYDPDKPIDEEDPDQQESPFLKNLKDLSGKRGGIVLIEHTAEYPTFITNVGMASTLVTFWHRAHPNDNPRASGDEKLHFLEPDQQSLFIAEIPKNEPVLCCSCNLFNVPLARHPVEPTDFLLVKSRHKQAFYIRHIEQSYCAGLLEARQRVMRPGTKEAQKFNINFITAVLINIFRGTELYAGKNRIQVQSVIREFFPDVNEPKLRGVLKYFADFYREQGNGYWHLKRDANPDQSFQKIDITPEEVCSYQSMLVGHYRLKKSGVNILIRSKRVYQQIQRLQGDLTKKVAEKIEIELMKTPWARTENFVKAFEGQAMQIQHTEDGQQIMRTKSRRSKTDNSDGSSKAQVKKPLANTDKDLRALTLKDLKDNLMRLGVQPSVIERLGRWKQVALLRELANSKVQDGKEDSITENFSRGPRNDYAASLQKYKKVYQETFLNNLNFISSSPSKPSKYDFDEGHDLDDIGLLMMREDTEEEDDIEIESDTEERKKKVINGGDPPELVPYGLATHKLEINWDELGFGGCTMRKAAKIINVSLSPEGRPVVDIQWRRRPHQIADLEKLESFVNQEQGAKTTRTAEDLEAYTLRSRKRQLLDKLRRTNQAIKNKGPNTPVLWYLPFAHQEILVTDPGGQLRFQFTDEVKKKILEASIKFQNFQATHTRSHTKKKKSGMSGVIDLKSDDDDDETPETLTFKTTRRTSAITRFNEKLNIIVQKLIADPRFEVFVYPVQKRDVPDYHKIITTPKCLKDIERSIHNDEFTTVNTFYSDMGIIRSNCKTYNETRNPDVYRLGEDLWDCFINLLQEYREELDEIVQEIDPVLRK